MAHIGKTKLPMSSRLTREQRSSLKLEPYARVVVEMKEWVISGTGDLRMVSRRVLTIP
jgi:hypothetical protein